MDEQTQGHVIYHIGGRAVKTTKMSCQFLWILPHLYLFGLPWKRYHCAKTDACRKSAQFDRYLCYICWTISFTLWL